MPAIAGRFSVPARMPRSCAPPQIRLCSGVPRLAYSTPTPLGPWNLWADRESMSTGNCDRSIGTCPTACTASVWNSTPFSRQTAPISAMGSTVPISLLANITLTRQVSGRIAACTASGVTIPVSETGSSVTEKPSSSSCFRVWRMAWCSIAVEMRCFLPDLAPA